MLKRAQVKVEVQVKIERSIETEPTGGAQGGVALAAAGGSGSMPAPDIGVFPVHFQLFPYFQISTTAGVRNI